MRDKKIHHLGHMSLVTVNSWITSVHVSESLIRLVGRKRNTLLPMGWGFDTDEIDVFSSKGTSKLMVIRLRGALKLVSNFNDAVNQGIVKDINGCGPQLFAPTHLFKPVTRAILKEMLGVDLQELLGPSQGGNGYKYPVGG
jgi:hypothetical protein